MSSNAELVRVNAPNVPARGADFGPTQPVAQVDLYRTACRALRGRYLLVTMLGLLGAVAGATLGWKRGTALYRSEGLIQIAYSRPSVTNQAEHSVPLEIVQTFLQSQQAVLSSRRVLDMALQDPAWIATRRGASPAVIGHFADNLKVEYRPNTDYLRISFTDRDPATTAAAVKSI
ncbi:MAG: hypothetical protein ACM359_20890, partial [Bacillota bacterium]